MARQVKEPNLKGVTKRFTRGDTVYDSEWVAQEMKENGDLIIRLLMWWTPNEFLIGPLTGQGAAGCQRD